MKRSFGLPAFLLFLFAASCHPPFGCAETLIVAIPPAEKTIGVGESFVLRYDQASGCSEQSITAADFRPVLVRWTTQDTLIIALDSAAARVTGRQVGEARVIADRDGIEIMIHVR